MSAFYTPQQNGKVERTNQSLIKKLPKVTNDRLTCWDKYVQLIVFNYNILPIIGLGKSPYELLYGRKMDLSAERMIKVEDWDFFGIRCIRYVGRAQGNS